MIKGARAKLKGVQAMPEQAKQFKQQAVLVFLYCYYMSMLIFHSLSLCCVLDYVVMYFCLCSLVLSVNVLHFF